MRTRGSRVYYGSRVGKYLWLECY